MHGIHFHKGRQSQLLEIGVSPALENTAVRDLCFVYLAWFERKRQIILRLANNRL